MAYRFTDTEKWTDPWFRKLSPSAKLAWMFLCDNCDNAGFLELDLELMSFVMRVPEEDLMAAIQALNSRFDRRGDTIWIRKFIEFQKNYPLNKSNNAHRSIISMVEGHPEFSDAQDLLPAGDGYIRCKLKQREVVWTRDRGICQYTNKVVPSNDEYEVDHIHPRSKGGGDVYSNLACSLKSFNRGKSDSLIPCVVSEYSASEAKRALSRNAVLRDSFNRFFGRSLIVINGKLREVADGQTAPNQPSGRGPGKGNSHSNGNSKDQVIYTKEFEEWWTILKRKNGKSPSFKAWKKAIKGMSPEEITGLADRLNAYWAAGLARDSKWNPIHSATWLNERRWEDEPPQTQTSANKYQECFSQPTGDAQ